MDPARGDQPPEDTPRSWGHPEPWGREGCVELSYPGASPKCSIPGMVPGPFAPTGSSERSLECLGRDERGNLGEPEVLGGLPAEQSQHKAGGSSCLSLRLLEFGMDVGLPLCLQWESSPVDLHLVQGWMPQNSCAFGSEFAPSSGTCASEFGLFCGGPAPRSGVRVLRRFCCGSALCSGLGVPKFCSGFAPHSEVRAPEFGRIVLWICPLIRSGSSKMQENSGVDLPHSGVGVP